VPRICRRSVRTVTDTLAGGDPDRRVAPADVLVSGDGRGRRPWLAPVTGVVAAAAVGAVWLPGQVRAFQADRVAAGERAVLAIDSVVEEASGGDSEMTLYVHFTNAGPRAVVLEAVSFDGGAFEVVSARLPDSALDPGQGGRAEVRTRITCGASEGVRTVVRARTADGKTRTTTARQATGGTSLDEVATAVCRRPGAS
jgi:hypothetical protein